MTAIHTTSHVNNQMLKVVKQWTIILIAAVCTGLLGACSKDKDEEVRPQERLPFLGTYKVIDKNNNNGEGTFQFTLTVAESSKGEDKVDLKGFRYVNSGVYGTIKGNKLTISQVLQDSDEKVEIIGEGTLEGNTLTYNYTLKHKKQGKQEKVYENSATATRQ
jgi:hypothetical protein